MLLKLIAYVLSGLIGLGIIFIGVRFLLAPSTAAAGYGVAAEQQSGRMGAYLTAKGIRDIASGFFVFILMAFQMPHILGFVLVAASSIPIVDAVIVHHTLTEQNIHALSEVSSRSKTLLECCPN